MSVPRSLVIQQSNTQIISVLGLQDSVSLAYINNATLNATLFDPTGIADVTFGSISFTYVASSNGNYNGTIPASFVPPTGGGYKLHLDGTDTSGNALHIEIPVVSVIRAS